MKQSEPSVGIFFVIDNRLLVDTTPLPQAGWYGEHRIHETGHDAYAEALGFAENYDRYPRGRVAFNSRTSKFTLLADRCILKRPEILDAIKKRLHLPDDPTVDEDSHYRCALCLRQKPEK